MVLRSFLTGSSSGGRLSKPSIRLISFAVFMPPPLETSVGQNPVCNQSRRSQI